MSDLILTDEVANSNNALLPAIIFLPDTKLPEKECEDEPESVEVGVIIEGEHFTAYYNYDDEYWWVHFGGITVGHRKLDDYDVEGWYYLAKKQLQVTPKYTQQNTKMNEDNAAGCAVALLIMMLFGLGLLIWVVIEITGFKL